MELLYLIKEVVNWSTTNAFTLLLQQLFTQEFVYILPFNILILLVPVDSIYAIFIHVNREPGIYAFDHH